MSLCYRCICALNRLQLSGQTNRSATVINQQFLRKYSSQQQQQQQPPLNKTKLWLTSATLTVTAFGAFYLWKEAKLRQMEAEVGVGRVGPDASVGSGSSSRGGLAVGGDFRLMDQDGEYRSRESLCKDGWLLLYFGFCHCPDVCPEQMEKMIEIVDRLSISREPISVKPVFITIDPERDTPKLVGEYVNEFGSKFIGLTGTKQEIEEVAKKFRVYYSKGPVDSEGDYIVDHAIIMYLVSPSGQVVDYYGQTKTSKEIADCIGKVVKRWQPEK